MQTLAQTVRRFKRLCTRTGSGTLLCAAKELLIHTTGSTCLLSQKSEVNIAQFKEILEEALAKTKWVLYPLKGNKEPVSVILALTFSADKVKYQHLAFKPGTEVLVELEQAERAKFSRY